MPLRIDHTLTARKLVPQIERMFDLSAQKILGIEKSWKPADGTPVFTVKGCYTSRGWTEWTQGFQFGSAILQFDATGEEKFLEIGRRHTIERMATHVSHTGVHDHGFNNISTYGNLLRLMHEGKIGWDDREKDFYELALKVSGAVQAARWTNLNCGRGYVYSFNGPHSLFIDTLRSLRSLAVAHKLGHVLMGERDEKISLLKRLIQHVETTGSFNVFWGDGRDLFDVRGRVAHETIFNVNDGTYRCPNSQQGFSPFTTWTRGLAWALCGFAEQLEFVQQLPVEDFPDWEIHGRMVRVLGGKAGTLGRLLDSAAAVADFYIESACADGVPMWDTGAPNLHRLRDCLDRPANPFNRWEPVDASAAAIAGQGFLRLGSFLTGMATEPLPAYEPNEFPTPNPIRLETLSVNELRRLANRYRQAGLTITRTLLEEPYLSTNPKHQGLLLHSVYHRPNGWDHIAPGQKVPNGESSMWGDYHLRELALLLLRETRNEPHLTFFGCVPKTSAK